MFNFSLPCRRWDHFTHLPTRTSFFPVCNAVVASVIFSAVAATVAVAQVAPLNQVTVPDVNRLGVLDKTGPNAGAWPKITNSGNQINLQRLGKALYWDMQVGGDGIQACASCHFHAGADNRKTNQMSPGFKSIPTPDFVHDLQGVGPNGTLTTGHFGGSTGLGLPVSEAALSGNTPDSFNGDPGTIGAKPNSSSDVNDVVSSQGIRLGTFHNLTALSTPETYGRADTATLEANAPGFNKDFSGNALGIPDTVRRVEPRNTPTVLNAIFNLRNFWDGRADLFFNGVNPLGFRDPDARVKVYLNGAVTDERLRIPFSSLASQAVGPVLNQFEMHLDPRTFSDVGKKLSTAQPLKGQEVKANDSLLGSLVDASGRGLTGTYGARIKAIFDERFWGDGSSNDVCLNNSDVKVYCTDATAKFTLLERNFALFFGLAVQAYEATLFTEQTIVDLIAGGVATGTLTNGNGRNQKIVNVAGLALENCILRLALNNSPAQQGIAENLCTAHYAKFIHPMAVTGVESPTAPNPLQANSPIGGCLNPLTCANSPNLDNARAALRNIERGIGRFFAGATACGICHFNPEFTGATVSALTGFGAAPVPPLPPGQARKIPPEVVLERMLAFNGARTVYDSGFYNIGVRPTPEDLTLGDQIGGVPLAFSKLAEVIAGGDPTNLPGTGLDVGKITKIAGELGDGTILRIPTSPTNLTPRPFRLDLVCSPGLDGQGNGQGEPNNNPNPNCVRIVEPGERLLRHGANKTSGLRNVKFTGPHFHNGGKMNLRQVLEFYKTAGNFLTLNFNNLDAGLRIFSLGAADESAVVEMMETGLTDWRVAFEQGKFDHPELCVPHGHDPATGKTVLAGIPAVGANGETASLQTFQEQLNNVGNRAHTLSDTCTMPGISTAGLSNIDVPPEPAP